MSTKRHYTLTGALLLSLLALSVVAGPAAAADGAGATNHTDVAATYNVSVTSSYYGGLAYVVDGRENRELTLTAGETYRFDLGGSVGGHPFHLSTSASGGGSAFPSAQVTQGVNVTDPYDGNDAAAQQGSVYVTVPESGFDADTVYYQCGVHSGMGAQITVEQPQDTQAPTADAGQDVTVEAGQSVTLDGSGSSDNVGITSYQWSFDDGTTASGAQVTQSYESAGTYTATLTVTDDAGNSDTDTATVTVEEQDSTQQTATVALTPSNVTATTATNSSVALVINNATAGVGQYDLSVRLTTLGGGRITAANATAGGSVTTTTLASAVEVTVTGTADTSADNLTVARLSLSGNIAGNGQSTVAAGVTTLTTVDGADYDSVTTADATLTVSARPLQLPNTAGPPASVDDDPQLEDVNGDGSAGLFDALTYYNNRDSDVIGNNPDQFDFDGDGQAGTLFDALALYNEIA